MVIWKPPCWTKKHNLHRQNGWLGIDSCKISRSGAPHGLSFLAFASCGLPHDLDLANKSSFLSTHHALHSKMRDCSLVVPDGTCMRVPKTHGSEIPHSESSYLTWIRVHPDPMLFQWALFGGGAPMQSLAALCSLMHPPKSCLKVCEVLQDRRWSVLGVLGARRGVPGPRFADAYWGYGELASLGYPCSTGLTLNLEVFGTIPWATFRTHSITFTMSSIKTLTKRICPWKACTSQTLTWKSVPTQIYGHYVTSAKRFLPTTKTMVISPLIHHQFTLTNLNQP